MNAALVEWNQWLFAALTWLWKRIDSETRIALMLGASIALYAFGCAEQHFPLKGVANDFPPTIRGDFIHLHVFARL